MNTTQETQSSPPWFAGHHRRMQCPRCRGPLSITAAGATCRSCGASCEQRDGILDFVGITGVPKVKPEGLIRLESPAVVARYEHGRQFFVQIMGKTFGEPFTVEDEDRYLQRFVRPVDGPVLDIACGAGRWTKVLAQLVGRERVIGLDFSRAMLEACRAAVPGVLVLRADAMAMPFADRSMGAASCWNALQLIPDTDKVIAEAARCVAPGGTFTCFTYRRETTDLYRYFRDRFGGSASVHPFDERELVRKLEAAGFEVVDVSGPSLILLFTARRR
jgi:SAM-dependent methyltransferase